MSLAIKTALLRVAADLKNVDALLVGNSLEDEQMRDALEDIYAGEYDRAIEKLNGEYDPTPWCSVCGAKTQKGCKCDI